LPVNGAGPKITQFKRFLFESALKRMSTFVSVEDKNSTEVKVLTKGAPEVIKRFLSEVPANYDSSYLKYTKEGARVLALAYKRDEAESDLTFCGFIISECPLKEDTFKVIEELKASYHEVKMITGDN
jgi:manganese-transporting P-type ATPase